MGIRRNLDNRLVWVLSVALIAVVAVVVYTWGGDDPAYQQSETSQNHSDQGPEIGGHPASDRSGEYVDRRRPQPPQRDEPGPSQGGAIDDGEEYSGEFDGTVTARQTADDAGERPEGLGPRSWAAEPDGVDVDALQQRLDEGRMRQDFELALRADRRRSIDEARARFESCQRLRSRDDIDDQIESVIGPTDRDVALGWTLRTEAGMGRIEEPEVLFRRGRKDEAFEQCIVDELDGLQFEATGDGAELDIRWASSQR